MNYPKIGLFIKPLSEQDSEIILAALVRNGLFPSKENDGIFLGQNAQPLKHQLQQVSDILFTSGIIETIHITQPEHKNELTEFTD